MKIFGYTETRCPRRSRAGVSDKRQTRARRRVARANSKKVASTRPEVPPPFPLYIEAHFSMGYEHHNSGVDVKILSSTTNVRPSDL
jgi:hypothetical protein